ncbi:MAG: right-handed parallel beta-helix repeat-containing protein [Deltaproteobacteria bacterium]|nr:MAG: right-handed parallel beta-helix repeat-containing protein [Deltaproteobacteria bacterium]
MRYSGVGGRAVGALAGALLGASVLALGACGDSSVTCFTDSDGDGFGAGGGVAVSGGECGPGLVTVAGDCDDTDSRVRPGAILHPDCDGDGAFSGDAVPVCGANLVCYNGKLPEGGFVGELKIDAVADCDDEDAESKLIADWFPDCDGDGYFSGAGTSSCGDPGPICAGLRPIGGFTIIDPLDQADCDDTVIAKHAIAEYAADCDGDGFFSPQDTSSCGPPASPCPAGAVPLGGFGENVADGTPRDCNDNDDQRFPGQRWLADCDRDGVYSAQAIVSCELPQSPCLDDLFPDGGYGHEAQLQTDCNDEDAEQFGGQTWYVDCDGDNAYDGHGIVSCEPPVVCGGAAPTGGWTHAPPALVDCDDTSAELVRTQAWYPDCDGDHAIAPKPVQSCGAPAESPCLDGLPPDGSWTSLIAGAFDCDDEDADYAASRAWYADCDGDGAFSIVGATGCAPPAGVCDDGQTPDGGWAGAPPAQTTSDCDDENPAWFPGQLWYSDCDADDAFDAVPTIACAPPSDACSDGLPPDGGFAHVIASVDCDDEDPTRIPETDWYADCDGDGFFRAASVISCGAPGTICVDNEPPNGGWTRIPPTTVDCNDEDLLSYPGQEWFPDCDGDGAFQLTSAPGCAPPATFACPGGAMAPIGGWVPDAVTIIDCDDSDASVHPGQSWYRDCDGDGAFAAEAVATCGAPTALCESGVAPIGGWRSYPPLPGLEDCNDLAANQAPTLTERCFDGINPDGEDDDCNGVPDNGCPFIHSSDILASETWGPGSHVVTTSIAVRGATLTIAAGARVTFFRDASLTVGPSGTGAAKLVVDGDRATGNPVVFTRDAVWRDVTALAPGDWGGIRLGSLADGSLISGADVEFATIGIDCDRADNVTLSDVRTRFSAASGVRAGFCVGLTLDTVLSSFNDASGVDLQVGSRASISGSELRNNAAYGLVCHGACMERDGTGAVVEGSFYDNVVTSNARGISGLPFLDWPALDPSSSYIGNGVDAIAAPVGVWESGNFDLHWRNLGVPYRFDYFVQFGAASTTTLTIDAGTTLEFGATNQLGIGTDGATRRAVFVVDQSESLAPVVLKRSQDSTAGPIHLYLGPGMDFDASSIVGLELQGGYLEIDTAPGTVATLEDVTVRDANGAGILVTNGSARFQQVEVTGCYNGVAFTCASGCSFDVDDSSFSANDRYGIECTGGCAQYTPSWTNNTFSGNGVGNTN